MAVTTTRTSLPSTSAQRIRVRQTPPSQEPAALPAASVAHSPAPNSASAAHILTTASHLLPRLPIRTAPHRTRRPPRTKPHNSQPPPPASSDSHSPAPNQASADLFLYRHRQCDCLKTRPHIGIDDHATLTRLHADEGCVESHLGNVEIVTLERKLQHGRVRAR